MSKQSIIVIEDLATLLPSFVQWRQTLANRTLALHLSGGRQLFLKTGSALWTQQRSSRVCHKRRRKEYYCRHRIGTKVVICVM